MYVATRDQIRAIENRATAIGMPPARLMENAGAAFARQLRYMVGSPKETVVLCGSGNNGGDGFVIARKLSESGYSVTVILTSGQPRTEAAAGAFAKLTNVSVISLDEEPYRAASAVTAAEVVVDAVYGIGFSGELPKHIVNLFNLVKTTAMRFAVDIPSGLDCDSGKADAHTFRAVNTITFIAAKRALVQPQNKAFCGTVLLVPIGIPEEEISAVLDCPHLKFADVAACFTKRAADSHKGTYGHLLAVCGSVGMAGAAILSARAALRSGVGLLTVALPRSIYPIVSAAVPEAIFLPLAETEEGTLAESALPLLKHAMQGKTAVLIGCGMGCNWATELLVCELLKAASVPIVLDADGLNGIAKHIDVLETVKAPVIVTPHPGEMARLVGKSVDEVQANRVHVAAAFAEQYGVTIALKGHRTVIANSECQYINTTGNPGMATGGSGDVLAGMIASFAAQGMVALDATKCGVHLHGLAGDKAAEKRSQHAMLPSDMIDELGGLFLELE